MPHAPENFAGGHPLSDWELPKGLESTVHVPTLKRDLGFFMACLSVALLLGLGAPKALQIAGAVALVAAYSAYATWTLRHSGPVESAEQLKALIAKGVLGAGAFTTDDCEGDFRTFSARDVEFLQEPQRRPYGIEAIFRDDSGNWYSLTQRFEELDESAD